MCERAGQGRIFIEFAPAGHLEQFCRDVSTRGEYFGNGSPEDKKTAHLGIVNMGPPLKP